MILKNEELIKEFYEKNRELMILNKLNQQSLKEVVHSPFRFAKEEMEKEELPAIRLKYFGIFQVYMGTAKGKLKKLESDFIKGIVKEDKYLRIKNMLTKYIEND